MSFDPINPVRTPFAKAIKRYNTIYANNNGHRFSKSRAAALSGSLGMVCRHPGTRRSRYTTEEFGRYEHLK